MKPFVPAFDALWRGSKAGLSHATRSIFLRLCQEVREFGRDGVLWLPSNTDDIGAILLIVRGQRRESALALSELTNPDDPMIEIDGDIRRFLRVMWWPDIETTLQDPIGTLRRWRMRRGSTSWRCSRAIRALVTARDHGRCRYCRADVTGQDATLDHVVPRIHGGDDGLYNLVLACRTCNSKKGGRTPGQAGMLLLPSEEA